ncbi:MAG TPA: Rrf2 family transcriptional regulator [Spirochaetota bacterium]|nr:Rrf2 family transcriptional regulator [Spirochaetota bacterium]HPJ33638.1 Rrf2 family transcriptional regulator [Spirochaetota bacterium]
MINSDFAIAVHSMLLLAAHGDRLLSSSKLSDMMNVHAVRVRKVLSLLKEEGFIASKEGVHGGFSLACEPGEVTLRSLYELTQRDILKPKCHDCSCCDIGSNIEKILDDILIEADGRVQEYLQDFTLKKILDLI